MFTFRRLISKTQCTTTSKHKTLEILVAFVKLGIHVFAAIIVIGTQVDSKFYPGHGLPLRGITMTLVRHTTLCEIPVDE